MNKLHMKNKLLELIENQLLELEIAIEVAEDDSLKQRELLEVYVHLLDEQFEVIREVWF